jgi:hypothetical protein
MSDIEARTDTDPFRSRDLNVLLRAVKEVLGGTDSAQTWAKVLELQLKTADVKFSKDADGNLVLQDKGVAATMLKDLGSVNYPIPPFLGYPYHGGTALTQNHAADLIFLVPVRVPVVLSIAYIRMVGAAATYNLGLYDNSSPFAKLTETQKVISAGEAGNVVDVPLGYLVSTPAIYWLAYQSHTLNTGYFTTAGRPNFCYTHAPGSFTLPATIAVPASFFDQYMPCVLGIPQGGGLP